MSKFGTILYCFAILSIAVTFSRESIEPILYLFNEHQSRNALLGVAGLIISTFLPLALSFFILIKINSFKRRLLVNFMFIPIVIVIFKIGASLFFYGANVSGDNSPEGYSLLVAGAFLALTLLVHTLYIFVDIYRGFATIANKS